MKSKRKWCVASLSALVLIPMLVFIENVQPVVENQAGSKVVFYVS